MSIFVRFWGTRGSIPTPGHKTRTLGGNTSCVELRIDGGMSRSAWFAQRLADAERDGLRRPRGGQRGAIERQRGQARPRAHTAPSSASSGEPWLAGP